MHTEATLAGPRAARCSPGHCVSTSRSASQAPMRRAPLPQSSAATSRRRRHPSPKTLTYETFVLRYQLASFAPIPCLSPPITYLSVAPHHQGPITRKESLPMRSLPKTQPNPPSATPPAILPAIAANLPITARNRLHPGYAWPHPSSRYALHCKTCALHCNTAIPATSPARSVNLLAILHIVLIPVRIRPRSHSPHLHHRQSAAPATFPAISPAKTANDNITSCSPSPRDASCYSPTSPAPATFRQNLQPPQTHAPLLPRLRPLSCHISLSAR